MPVIRDKDTGQWAPNGGRVRPPSRTDWRTATVHADGDDDDDRAPAGPAVMSDGTARGDALAARAADVQAKAKARAHARAERQAQPPSRRYDGKPESPDDTRGFDLRERGYQGAMYGNGYATTEAESDALHARDRAKRELERNGPDCEEDGDRFFQQRYEEADAAFQRERVKGDKVRAQWGQDPLPDPDPDPAPQRAGRVRGLLGRGRAKADETLPGRLRQADQAIGRGVDKTAMTAIGGAARKVADTVDKAEVT